MDVKPLKKAKKNTNKKKKKEPIEKEKAKKKEKKTQKKEEHRHSGRSSDYFLKVSFLIREISYVAQINQTFLFFTQLKCLNSQ